MEASTTKASSRGRVVIPINVRKAAGFKEGDEILAMVIDDAIILRKIGEKSLEDALRSTLKKARRFGFLENDPAWTALDKPRHWGVKDAARRVDEAIY